jgi:uncharacterized protein (DUF2147 family)
MKKAAFFGLVLLMAAGLCFAADPVEGYWKSVDENGKTTGGWEIYTQGGLLFGRMVVVAGHSKDVVADACKKSYKNFPVAGDVSKMKVVGTPWIYNLERKSEGQWGGSKGTIVNPEDGKDYYCTITFRKADGKKYKVDTLEMRGTIGLGIGRSQFWQKATKAELDAIK